MLVRRLLYNYPPHDARHQYAHLSAFSVPTKEIAARQIGNLQCNIDRLKIVATLAKMQGTLAGIASGGYVAPVCVLSLHLVTSIFFLVRPAQ